MMIDDRVLQELREAIEEAQSPLAVVAFVISETADEEEQQVKIIAAMPKNSAAEVRTLVDEAMEEMVSQTQPEPYKDAGLPFADKMALSICGEFFDDLPERARALWEFNEEALHLFDSLVTADLARADISDWYWQFRAFLDDKPYDITPELRQFIKNGPTADGQELASMVITAMVHLQPIDPNDLPSSIDHDTSDEATQSCISFLDDVVTRIATH